MCRLCFGIKVHVMAIQCCNVAYILNQMLVDILILFLCFRNEKGDTLNGSYYYVVNPLTHTAVGAKVRHNFSKNENTDTIGTPYSLDPLTSLKARVNNSGKVSALL